MVKKFSTSDSGVATVSPMGTTRPDTTLTSPNIFDLAVTRLGFIYPLLDEDNVDRVDVCVSHNDDDTNSENDDQRSAKKLPTVSQTPD